MNQFFIALGVFNNNPLSEAQIAKILLPMEVLNELAVKHHCCKWNELNEYGKRNVSLHAKMKIELRNHKELGVTSPFIGGKLGYIDELTNMLISKIPLNKITNILNDLRKLGYDDKDIVLYIGRGY